MSIYYQKQGITLYHADARDISISCDLIVTDPPNKDFRSGKSTRPQIIGGKDLPVSVDALKHSLKRLRRGRHIYIFSGDLDLSDLPVCSPVELIWDKQIIGPGDLSAPWGPAHEKIQFCVYEPSAANRAKGYGNLSARLRKGSVLREMRQNNGGSVAHVNAKPIGILRQMIESSSVMGEIVYDPFAGGGSTLIAANDEGRLGIGCEIDEAECEKAAKRIEAYLATNTPKGEQG